MNKQTNKQTNIFQIAHNNCMPYLNENINTKIRCTYIKYVRNNIYNLTILLLLLNIIKIRKNILI